MRNQRKLAQRYQPTPRIKVPSLEVISRQPIFSGGGEMGALVRSFDWAKTPLGSPHTWSPALKSTTRLVLANCCPMLLCWGPDFYQIYNDAYIPVLGDKHPHCALGKPFRECWSEVFPLLEPLVQSPLEGGPPTWMEDILLEVNRFGFDEETHFTIGYSPVPDDTAPHGIGGVLATVHEITGKVLSERRVAVLRDLGSRPAEAKTAEEACQVAVATLAKHTRDIPFALLYLVEGGGERARLAAEAGASESPALRPDLIYIADSNRGVWPLASCKSLEEIILVNDLHQWSDRLPVGPWSNPSHVAAIVPIKSNVSHQFAGYLVAGISPRLRFDDFYRGFLELTADQIATAIANARSSEKEHRRTSHQSPVAAVTAPKSASRPRIVLAEDNADMRDYLERLLAGVYRVEPVADGKAALETILRDPPDLVLTDVMMPQLDGFALLKALRADPSTASIPIILLSARAGEESRVDGIKAGADDYLIKPFSAREIVARVENHIALSRLRHEGEDQLRRSEERFRALVSASSDVIFRLSPDWREIWKLEGRGFLAASELPTRSWLEAYIDPADQPQVQQAIETAIGNKTPLELEHRIRRADGSLGWSFSRAVPLLDADDEITEWFGAARDITSRKQSEEALLRSEKLATLGRMAATIAHEINNPLESVTNLLFLANHGGDLPEQTQNLLKMADVELQRVAHIARQSLGFYRESNAPALTSVNDLLDSAVELLKGKVSEKNATIEKEWKSDTRITAVAGELRQIFSNLLANSLDAIDRGGKIRIRSSESGPSQGPLTSPHPHSVRITFVDDGRGIHPSIRRHIFEPFFTTKGTVGTGLGLWVTRQIVDKHGGTISVHSCTTGNQKGTAFSIVLPVEAVPGLAAK